MDHDGAEENSKPTAEIDPFVFDAVRQRDWKRRCRYPAVSLDISEIHFDRCDKCLTRGTRNAIALG